MSNKPTLRPKSRIGPALVAVAGEIIAEARKPLRDKSHPDAERVHDFRKALKRWRALLRLLETPIGKRAKIARGAARELARELARTRDAQSALDALTDMERIDHALSARTLASLHQRLHAMKRRRERALLSPALLRRLQLRLNSAERTFHRWPLIDVGFKDIVEGLTETYRRARRAMPNAWQDAAPEQLHELRKRVVEHRYQMELVESLWPRFGKLWVEETQRLRNRLGAHQDLAVLARLTAPRQPLAPWRARLAPLIAQRQQKHARAAARLAGRLFAERAKAFYRRLNALAASGK
jgi:CHAD domain-containing protein